MAGVATAVAVTSLLNLWEAREYLDRWPGERTRTWVLTAQSSLQDVADSRGRPVVRGGHFPHYMFSDIWGRVRIGPLASGADLPAEFTSKRVPTAHIGDDGRAFPVAYVTGHRFALDSAAVRRALAPPRVWRRSGSAWCIETPPWRGVYVDARLPRPVRGHETVVRADTAEPLPGYGLAVFPDSGRGYPRRPRAALLESRPGQAVAVLNHTELSGVRITVPAGRRVCLRRLEVGATQALR